MSDDTSRHDDAELPAIDPLAPEEVEGAAEVMDAEQAEAEEAARAAEEVYVEEHEEVYDDEDAAQAELQAVLADAQRDGLRARAAWSLIHKEHMVFLFANCLFFVGVLAAWSRLGPGAAVDAAKPDTWPANYLNGLDTIRGAAIFALAIYGFWTVALNILFRQLKIWPFLISALLALWVGIPGFTRIIGSDRWKAAVDHLEGLPTKTLLDKALIPLSSVPPAYWLLTAGGAIVLIVLLRGIIGGAAGGGGKPASGAAGGRRRRR